MKHNTSLTTLISMLVAACLVLAGCADDGDDEQTSDSSAQHGSSQPFPDDDKTDQDATADDASSDDAEDSQDADSEDEDAEEAEDAEDAEDTGDIIELGGDAWDVGDDEPPHPEDLEQPSVSEVHDLADITPEGMEPDELVITAANIMTTWIATEDASETHGYRRALNLFTDAYDELFTPPQNPIYTDAWWEATEHEGISVGWSTITDTYDEGDTIEYRVVTQPTWVGDDGWTQRDEERQWSFIVSKDGDDWIISNYINGAFQ